MMVRFSNGRIWLVVLAKRSDQLTQQGIKVFPVLRLLGKLSMLARQDVLIILLVWS